MRRIVVVLSLALLFQASTGSARDPAPTGIDIVFTVSLDHGFRAGDCPEEQCTNEWLSVFADGSARATVQTYQLPIRSNSPAPANPQVLIFEKEYAVRTRSNGFRQLINIVKSLDPAVRSTGDRSCSRVIVQSYVPRFQIEDCVPTSPGSPLHRISILTRALIEDATRRPPVKSRYPTPK